MSDRVLEGQDSGVFPDGRPYRGTLTVRKIDQNTFTFEYKGHYTDGKKEEYKGSGKSVRVTAKDNAAAVKALRDWGDILVGGVWTTTDRQGKKYEERWQWVLNKSFLQLTRKVDGDLSEIVLGGPEPGTGRWLYWVFISQGGMGQGAFDIGKDGAFLYQSRGHVKDGPFRFKGRSIRVDGDTLRDEIEENEVGGKKLPPETLTWTRKK